jgi:hypothetical protein
MEKEVLLRNPFDPTSIVTGLSEEEKELMFL